MRRSQAILLILVFSLSALYACKSVETTSAMLHNQHGQYEKAIEMASLALEKNPFDSEAHFQLGISYSYIGKMRMAYNEFQRAAELDPGKLENAENNIKHNWAKHFNSGVAEFQNENFMGAANEFNLAADADPRQVKGWLNLAKVYYSISKEDTTYLEKVYKTVDTLMIMTSPQDESYGNVLSLTGRVMIRRGMKDRAVEIFEKLMLDDPANFEIVEEVGDDFLEMRDWENAAQFLEMASEGRLKTDSEDFETYYNLGVCYYNLKDYMKSVDEYQSALRMRPDDKQASYSLLLTYYQAEFFDEAVLLGQEYTTSIAPEDPRGWQVLGLSYRGKGMKIKAEEAFQKYQELVQ